MQFCNNESPRKTLSVSLCFSVFMDSVRWEFAVVSVTTASHNLAPQTAEPREEGGD